MVSLSEQDKQTPKNAAQMSLFETKAPNSPNSLQPKPDETDPAKEYLANLMKQLERLLIEETQIQYPTKLI